MLILVHSVRIAGCCALVFHLRLTTGSLALPVAQNANRGAKPMALYPMADIRFAFSTKDIHRSDVQVLSWTGRTLACRFVEPWGETGKSPHVRHPCRVRLTQLHSASTRNDVSVLRMCVGEVHQERADEFRLAPGLPQQLEGSTS